MAVIITIDKNNFDFKNKKIACFDFDFTIVKPKKGKTFPTNKNDWEWLRENVPEIIKNYYNKGFSIYVFTNQTKEWKLEMIENVLKTLEIPIHIIVGFGKKDDDIKKPNPKLFTDNIKLKFDKKKSFYTGDAAGRKSDWDDNDIRFAENIGIDFKYPEDVFPLELTYKVDENDYYTDKQEVIIMIGYPASGKSTFAKNKFEKYGYIILSGDKLKTLPKMLKEAKIHLDEGKSVVFDATNYKKENRSKIIELAKTRSLPVRCFVMTMSMEESMAWNERRAFEKKIKKIPAIAYYTMRKKYEEPTAEECEIVLI